MPTPPKKKPSRPRPLETLAVIHPNAAGLDIGSREIWASMPADRAAEPVRRFGTFTPDLEQLVDWLAKCHIETVAMESTGVYWIPVFELLEQYGFECHLISAAAIKRVPGRKTDYLDCQWIQKLHSLGMLTASFRPDAEMRTLRTYLRHRAELLERRAPHILHLQKALQQMNLQLHHVLSDVTGVKIVRAIVAGERDPLKLAQLRNPACKSSTDRIAQALTGTWLPEHLFVLRQSVEFYDFYTRQVAECDAVIERQFATLKPRWESEVPEDLPPRATGASENRGAVLLSAASPPPLKPDSHSKNQPSLRTRAELLRVTGVDLVAVHGISASLAQTIVTETGTDMRQWPTEKHFGSWLGVAPHNDVSGGKIRRSRTLPTDNRAGQAFRQAAAFVSRSQCAFGAYYRRKKAHLGPMPALGATAHKIARTVYHMLKHHAAYYDIGATQYDRTHQERELLYLKKKAAKLGFTLTPHEPLPIAGHV